MKTLSDLPADWIERIGRSDGDIMLVARLKPELCLFYFAQDGDCRHAVTVTGDALRGRPVAEVEAEMPRYFARWRADLARAA